MALFEKLQPTVLKETSESQAQLDRLNEILPKASPSVQEVIQQDISLCEMGIYGENKILFELKNSHLPIYIIHDLFLKSGDLTAQIDFLVIGQKCNYVIETKNLFGNIEINNKGEFIRTVKKGKYFNKEGIYSPITQNQRHLALMREITLQSTAKNIVNSLFGDAFAQRYVPIVVLANDKTVLNDRFAKKEIKAQILRADQLVNYIRYHESSSSLLKQSVKDMKEQAELWLSRNTDNPTDYIEKYRVLEREARAQLKATQEQAPTPITDDTPVCPNCKVKMVKRVAGKGARSGKEFWGCPNFPRCRNIVNID